MTHPYTVDPRVTIHTTSFSSIKDYEFGKRVRDMIHAFLWTTVKYKDVKSQKCVVCEQATLV